MVPASAEQSGGAKAKNLVEKSNALLSEQNTEYFAVKTYDHKDYSILPNKEKTVMLFWSLLKDNSGISELGQEESVWQINWVHGHEPASQHEIYNKKCDRFWFPITFRDATMQHTLWI